MNWRYMKWMVPLWLLAGGAAADAGAETAASAPAAPAGRPASGGEVTRQWLDRQRQGSQASARAQPLSGPVLEQIHERYQKSFAHPIPERFESERLGAGTASR